jgi:ABC-type amino acid transport substrate-binding protein
VPALLLLCAAATNASPLRVCLLAHNLPYSAGDGAQGFDVDVARAVAARLQRPLEPVWTANPTTIQEIDDSDFPLERLVRGACDAIFSIPGPARDSLRDAPGVALGAAYYGAAFELIGPAGTPSALRDLRGKRVAIQAQTVASFALAMLHGRQQTHFSVRAALASVATGEADAALLWGPVAGWQLKQTPPLALSIVEGYAPPAALAWNLHVATRAQDAALRTHIDDALAALAGQLPALAAAWGLPWHAPFAATYSLTEINKLR